MDLILVELEKYKQTVATINGVIEVKNLKGRTYGNSNIVDVVITVQNNLDIIKAHEIATNVEDTLIKQHNIHDVHVHVEPINEESITQNFI